MAASDTALIEKYISHVKVRCSIKFGIEIDDVRVGHALLQILEENPDFVGHIDVSTGQSETNKCIRATTVQLAAALKSTGLQPGDVTLMVAPNSLHLAHALFAGIINGLPVVPLDPSLLQLELDDFVDKTKPKVIYCCKENAHIVEAVIKKYGNIIQIVLDDTENDIDAFVKGRSITNDDCKAFVPAKVDKLAPAWMLATSGTTGKSKLVVMTHDNIWFNQKMLSFYYEKVPSPMRSTFIVSSPQWMTCISLYTNTSLFVITRLISSAPLTPELSKRSFQKYKPSFILCSPTKLLELQNVDCDFSSLRVAMIGGSALIESSEKRLKENFPTVKYFPAYGMTEALTLVLHPKWDAPPLALGKEFNTGFKYRLVDQETGKIITEPNTPGEMHVKPESEFVGYLNNPEETALVKTEDGYVKTGDLVYKDKEGYYYFVERLKVALKYKTFQVYPSEIEAVLCSHAAVAGVGVVGLPDVECGDKPLAFVVKKDGHAVTAKELCDFVASKLSDPKKLRGGIIFVKELPLTPSFKVNRGKLKQMIDINNIEF